MSMKPYIFEPDLESMPREKLEQEIENCSKSWWQDVMTKLKCIKKNSMKSV